MIVIGMLITFLESENDRCNSYILMGIIKVGSRHFRHEIFIETGCPACKSQSVLTIFS